MKVNKIYFDMDDTVADFSRGLIEICGIKPIPQDQSTDEQDDAMWEAVRKAGDFYYRLKECEPGMDLFRKLREKYGDKVEILTAVPKAKRGIVTSESDKKRWVVEHMGANVVVNIAYSAEEKKNYVTGPDCFLVDDLKKNIDSWREAGGTGIWFLKDDEAKTTSEIRRSNLLDLEYKYYDPKFDYEAEWTSHFDILSLYRYSSETGYQEYTEDGWKYTSDAADAFHGEIYTTRPNPEDVEEYLMVMNKN